MRSQHLLALFFLLQSFMSFSQFNEHEYKLIRESTVEDHSFDPRKPSFLKVGKNAFTRYNPISLTLGGFLFLYQKTISPQLQSNCPYEISCSAFSKECIQAFGIVKGVALTADRLSRCTQFTIADIHPSQFNTQSDKIVDNIDKYRHRPHDH